MVHALEEIRRLLKPDGYLINILPIRKAPLIQVYQVNELLFTESDPGYDDDEGLIVDNALEQVVRRGLFRIEGWNEFEMVVYASSVAAIRDYWAQCNAYEGESKDEAIVALKDAVYAKADEIMQNARGAEVSYHEWARITRLNPTVSK